jgi:hypothetical protein
MVKRRTVPVKTEAPVHIRNGRAQNAGKTAIVVCHGMGQQVRFQTIGDLIATLSRRFRVAKPVSGRLVRFDDLTLGRAEMTWADEAGEHEVHVYEAYWAPLTEGRVNLRDVLSFLLHAGIDGTRAALRGTFHRFMFNDRQTFPVARWTFLSFLVALLVVGALFAINFAASAIFANHIRMPGFAWAEVAWFPRAIANDVLIMVVGIAMFAVPFLLPRATAKVGRSCEHARGAAGAKVAALPIYALVMATIVAGCLVTAHTASAFLGSDRAFTGTVIMPAWLLNHVEGKGLVGLWGIVAVTSAFVKRFLTRFGGDVAAYLSAHRLSKFDEIRSAIQKTVFNVVCAVYKEGGYGSCVVVGHSLGAVAAYDALNAVLVEEAVTGEKFSPTAGLITFGAPLDKTAFVFRTHNPKDCDVREALAAAVQPLIAFEGVRPRWINIWSPNDIISGSLELYDRFDRTNSNVVANIVDWEADKPLYAHVQYWNNDVLAETIHDLCIPSGTMRRVA